MERQPRTLGRRVSVFTGHVVFWGCLVGTVLLSIHH